ncbi:MAG TPA: hypothetical protein VFB67_01255, partial [Candidatus Polarisedimenticolaceae bacterium]|nr:hypothetical protein [Candidatus Polarisedimenticolaceae bacterium]
MTSKRTAIAVSVFVWMCGMSSGSSWGQFAALEIDLASDVQDVTVWGTTDSDFTGSAVHVADVNADGIPDLI